MRDRGATKASSQRGVAAALQALAGAGAAVRARSRHSSGVHPLPCRHLPAARSPRNAWTATIACCRSRDPSPHQAAGGRRAPAAAGSASEHSRDRVDEEVVVTDTGCRSTNQPHRGPEVWVSGRFGSTIGAPGANEAARRGLVCPVRLSLCRVSGVPRAMRCYSHLSVQRVSAGDLAKWASSPPSIPPGPAHELARCRRRAEVEPPGSGHLTSRPTPHSSR